MKPKDGLSVTEDALGQRGRRSIGVKTGALVITLAFSAPLANATDIDDVLHGIQMVESSGRDIGRHPDGVTYGRYGVTYMAVKELRRLGRIDGRPVDLVNPATNKRIATLYLKYLKQRYGSWWRAVEHYNPGSSTYARKVWAEMDRRRRHLAARG